MAHIAFVCSGQGAQQVGMGADYLKHSESARQLFALATETCGFDVADVCINGPEDKLSNTRYTQPALVVMSLIAADILQQAGITPEAVAGFSLGEYAAHAIAGTLSAKAALQLVATRANLMADAAKEVPGSMLALLKATPEAAQALCERCAQGQVLEVANLNCPGQVVISGQVEAIERAKEDWPQQGGRALPVATSGAFHSSLMKNASEKLSQHLAQVEFAKPTVQLYCNVDAQPLPAAADAQDRLTRQMYSSVHWEETVHNMIAAGIDTFVELGPSAVLSGMIKRINKEVTRISVGSFEEAQTAIEALGGTTV